MKNICLLFALLCTVSAGIIQYGCSKGPEPSGPSDVCDLKTFVVEAVDNGIAHDITFVIDEQTRTVKGAYQAEVGNLLPDMLYAIFTVDGVKAKTGEGETVTSGTTLLSFAEPFDLIVVAESGATKTYRVSVEDQTPRRATNDLLTFWLEKRLNSVKTSVQFTIDENELTVTAQYLTWIEGDATLKATFTTNGEKVFVNNEEIESENVLSFAEDFSLRVEAQNGDSKTYTVSLNCPQVNTELPVLHIHQPASAITSQEDYTKTALEMYSPTTTEGWWSKNDAEVEIRGRGNSTWGLPKKPYRIKFPEKHSPLGLDHANEKSWVLLAHDMDKSLLRNHMAFAMSRIMFNPDENYHDPKAIMFTPSSLFVNVYMNGEYHGLYQMSDQLDKGDGRIDVDKLTESDGDDPDKITGGYIVETSIHNDEVAPVRFHSGVKGIQMDHKYPEDDDYDPAQYEYIEDFITAAETVLYSADFKDPVNGWRKYFDEKTMADFIIIKEFAVDRDGYTSTYMYKRRGVDKLFFGPVWDLDKGWENNRFGGYDGLMIHIGNGMPRDVEEDWFERVWQDENFRAFVGVRWAAKKEELTAAIVKVLDEKPVEMKKAIEANFDVWPFQYQASWEGWWPPETYELEIEQIRSVITRRVALLDQLLQ